MQVQCIIGMQVDGWVLKIEVRGGREGGREGGMKEEGKEEGKEGGKEKGRTTIPQY